MKAFRIFASRKSEPQSARPNTPTLSMKGNSEPQAAAKNETGGWTWGDFRVLELVGRGAFGRVYRVWDETLQCEFALKLLPSDGSGVASLVLNEARLLARIRHQNVCRVYGVASNDGMVGIWMEFIRGSTLAQLIDTQGAFAAEEAALAGIALCGAVAEIHRNGIIHGDIKAQNVIREKGGRLLLTDFGLGRDVAAEPEHHQSPAGTPVYMPPELFEGATASTRSDIYSLGVLLFYLVTRSYPVTGRNEEEIREAHRRAESQSLRDQRPDLPEAFVRVVERAISPNPQERFATPGQMNAALRNCLGKRRLSPLLLLVAALPSLALMPAGQETLERWLYSPASQMLLVGDFENQTPHTSMDLTVREGLAVALEKSRRFYVFPRGRILEMLELMQLPRDTRIDAGVARHISRRAGIPIAISGSIAPIGSGFEIVVRATDTTTDDTRAVIDIRLEGREAIAAGLDRLAADLRTRLGERRLPLAPLPPLTTRSLPALERYARGVELANRADPDGALKWFLSAVEHDQDFAMAHRHLATVYSSLGRFEESLNAANRAFDLRYRTSERERHLIEGIFHLRRSDFLEAAESYRSVSTLYPQDADAHQQLAQLYIVSAAYDASLSEMRQAVQLNPRSASYRGLFARILAMANRDDEALSEIQATRAAGLDKPFLLWAEAHARLGRGEFQLAREAFGSLRRLSNPWESAGVLGEASALILQGGLQDAQTELEQGAFAHVKARNPENEAKSHLWLARLYLLQGEKRRALSQLGLIGTPVSSPANVRILRDMGLILAEMGAHDPASSVVRQLEQIAAEYPSLYTRGIAYHVRGELNRAMDRWQEAHNNLQQARMQWGDALTLGSLARYHEGRQDYGVALKLYQEVLAHKGLLHNREFAGFWVLAHLGAARCQRQLGNLRPAAEYYDRFLSFWGNQSPGFALVYEAKQQRDSLKALGF